MNTALTTTTQDIFKNSFLDNFTTITLGQGLLIMGVSILLGLLICLVYRISYRGVLFSRSFCVSLLAMNVITTLIIMTVTSNIVLSLGMVGALSIVRFRTAIKDPLDIAFLYYSICAGIMCGANLLGLACAGVVLIGIILFVASRLPGSSDAYILMVTINASDESAVYQYIEKNVKKIKLKSKALVGTSAEVAYEVTLRGDSTKFCNKLSAAAGVASVTIVKSTGEYV